MRVVWNGGISKRLYRARRVPINSLAKEAIRSSVLYLIGQDKLVQEHNREQDFERDPFHKHLNLSEITDFC